MNITSIMEISAKLYPNKNIYSLSKEEKQKVLQVYYDNN